MAVKNISSPQNQIVNVNIEPGETVAFDFDISTASFERSGSDLTISLEGGGELVLTGFFVADATGQLPELLLEDGTQIASSDFLAAINPDLDVAPAAGGAASGGMNTYDDSAGSLLGGLSGSDSLGTTSWTNPAAAANIPTATGAVAAAASIVPSIDPVDLVADYNARAVVFTDNGKESSFNLRLDANKTVGSIESLNGVVDVNSLQSSAAQDGSMQLDINAVPVGSANVYDYIAINYTDGTQTIVQVIINQNGSYSAAAEDALNPHNATIAGEWHTQIGKTITDGTGNLVIDNTLTPGNVASQNNTTTSTGNDGRVGGSGNDELWVKAFTAVNDTQNMVDTGAGADSVHVAGGMGAFAGSSNTITTGLGAGNSISTGSNVSANFGGTNTLESESVNIYSNKGNISLGASGTDSTNTLTAGQAGITITKDIDNNPNAAHSAINAGSKGVNSLNAEGDITVNISGGNNSARAVRATGADSENKLTSTDGDININASTSASNSSSMGVYAEVSGVNTLNAVSDINIEATSLTGANATGVGAATGGANNLTATSNINVAANGGSGVVQGVAASQVGSANTLTSAGGDININVHAAGTTASSSGLFAGALNINNQGLNTLEANNGSVNITVTDAGDSNTISNSGYTAGMYSTMGENVVTAKEINIDASGSNNVYGVNSSSNNSNNGGIASENTLSASGDINVSATSTNAGAGKAYGLASTHNDNSVVLTAGGDINISASGARDTPNAAGAAYAVFASNGASTDITAAGTLAINANVTTEAQSGDVYGVYASNGSSGNTSQNTLTADIIEVNANTGVGTAYGVFSTSTHSSNVLNVSNVLNINAVGSSNAFGLYAKDASTNTIQAATGSDGIVVTITAAKGAADGIAMHAASMGINVINGSDADDSITINGNVTVASGGTNSIDAGLGDDTITLNGKVGAGALTITAGDGYDTLVLQAGSVTDFNSSYKAWLTDTNLDWDAMGIESVRVEVGGNVDLDGLNWVNGVFSDTGCDFILDVGSGSTMSLMGDFDMGLGDDSFALVGDVDFAGGLNISGGGGMDTLKLGEFDESTLSLNTLADVIDGFEVIDLSGGNGSNLNIDSLLSDLGIDAQLDAGSISGNTSTVNSADLANGTVLRVTGGADDNVTVDGNVWNANSVGQVQYDDVTYEVYTNNTTGSEDQYLLIQTGLM